MEFPSPPAHRGALPWQGLLLTASLLTFWSHPTTAQKFSDIPVELVPPESAVGKEVLLLAHKLPETFQRLDWYRGEPIPSKIIVTLRKKTENIINGPAHSGRETLYSNGSLLIQNLSIEDKGNYSIQVLTVDAEYKNGKTELRVYEPLSKPNITANNSRPLEQESVVLTCEPLSPHTTYRWFNNTQSVKPSARLQLSMDNRTLTVLHIIRHDTGSYECETSNPVSVHRSDPVKLTVLYGPDPLIIYPSKRNYRRGENLSLSCLTASYPPAQFSWFMEKKPLGSTQTLSIPNLSLNDSGSYSCLASNSFTHINRTIVINITVSVTEGAGPVVLTCITNDTEVSTWWYLNDKNLQPTERRKLPADNRTLTLQLVIMDDDGDFECEVFNPISSCRSGRVRLQATHKWPAKPGLSTGAIAGIVIGVLAGAALIAALVYFLYVRKTGGANEQRHLTENKLSASNHSQDYSENSSNNIEEPAYSSLDFDAQKHRKEQVAESPGPTLTETLYSQVKKN